MYQVTAIFQDSEIGYGEGESLEYATDECRESIPDIFVYGSGPECLEEINLSIIYPNGMRFRVSLYDHMEVMDTLKYIG
jgi:hypothetical protein